jgi:hypothetical protein
MGKARTQASQATITLDTGALIALERGSKKMIALLEQLASGAGRARVPAGVIGQAGRGGSRQAVLARFLRSLEVEIVALDGGMARACGELCRAANTDDVIDASVVITARQHGDVIVKSDPEGLRQLDAMARLERV